MDILTIINDTVHTNWKRVLLDIAQRHATQINSVVQKDTDAFAGTLDVLPSPDLMFRAFNEFNVEDTRALILSQDPYPTKGHAMGLCFSVPCGTKPMPPSLRNIFKELEWEHARPRASTDLSDWAVQGVLLLNTALTVLEKNAGRHLAVWKPFTTDVIKFIAESPRTQNIVYMLWGEHAKEVTALVDLKRNCVLTHSHPSPLARRPFIGNNHFKLANEYLESCGKAAITWL